ncbi:hypothetical protein J31TS4_26040 [Paenibacillus sp. J31TS4]|uniref:DUF4037 domain-containing protein n=1 Tax=Paenibacillus sp. J31TS4 TaxID=2807195 RepID=UPI001B2A07E9|nr:DUF4037 domain-containing protein [Paenibacillus sp. J31TS4]GIP39324.1 hypothetical protein J31TS4_26040 [Paenibacillus sp. J31TS4]
MVFMHGIELCKKFHFEFVEPLLSIHFPNLSYSSALIGPGSEVLGYDTEMSTDHDWGPRVVIFLQAGDLELVNEIRQALQTNRPEHFYGYPVDLNQTVITSLAPFLESKLSFDFTKSPEPLVWLAFPSQSLAEIVGGEVFRDDLGHLTTIRKQLKYYPHDIWLYLMASVWNRIGQEEHLVLRAGYVGDEFGSSIIGSRLVRDMMNLCFLMERQYAPYPKWFGTDFKKLDCADELLPMLMQAQSAVTWKTRENALCEAYEGLARMHNRLGISEWMNELVSPFFDRPYKVIQGGTFADAIARQITDPIIRKLSQIRLIGGIDQITDNTDFRLISQWVTGEQSTERSIIRMLYNKIPEELYGGEVGAKEIPRVLAAVKHFLPVLPLSYYLYPL